MKKSKIICVLACFFAVTFLLFSCGETEKIAPVDIADLSLSELEGYVAVAKYKDVSIALGEKSKEEAISDYLTANSKLNKLPEDAVEYYGAQLKEEYKYHAKQSGRDYDELLHELGLDEEALLKEARTLVYKDIIFAIIQKKESICITDEEKKNFFDRYVTKYAELYGYSEEYVRANLVDEVYQTMLYDKTMEYLIINNDVK